MPPSKPSRTTDPAPTGSGMEHPSAPRQITPQPRLAYAVNAAILLVATFIGYWWSLDHGFVLDDKTWLPVESPTPLSETSGRTQGTLLDLIPILEQPDRPLTRHSFALTEKIFPAGSATLHRLGNLLLHSVNAILLSLLLIQLGLTRWQSLAACLLFCLHPALSESVFWISARAELLGAFFALIGLLILTRKTSLFGALGFLPLWMFAILSHENLLLLPLLAAVLILSLKNETSKTDGKFWGGFLAISALCGSLLYMVRPTLFQNWDKGPFPSEFALPAIERVTTGFKFCLLGLWHWCWPQPLSIYHPIPPAGNLLIGVLIILAWGFIVSSAFKFRRSLPWLFIALGWFLIANLLHSDFLFRTGQFHGERALYLPSLFLAPATLLAAQWIIARWIPGKDGMKIASPALLMIWAAFCVFLIWNRSGDWKSTSSLWNAARATYPNSLTIQCFLAENLYLSGRFQEALEMAAKASPEIDQSTNGIKNRFLKTIDFIEVDSKRKISLLNYYQKLSNANDLAKNMKPQEALQAYKNLIQENPEQEAAYEAIGDLYIRLENPVSAYRNYSEALKLGLATPQIFAKHAQALSQLGRKAEAVLGYEKSLALNPKNFLVHYNMGIVLGEIEDYQGAIKAFRKALDLSPQFAAPRVNLASIHIHLKQYDEAKQEIQKVVQADPKLQSDLTRDAVKLLEKIPRY